LGEKYEKKKGKCEGKRRQYKRRRVNRDYKKITSGGGGMNFFWTNILAPVLSSKTIFG
jgi:hypothetical protein